MRARNIKPGFYKNEDLLECSIWARHLAPGLWMLADRDGRLEDRPKRIKLEIFPCDDVDINLLLDELARAKHITRYNHGEQRFIQINKFSDHQRPHSNETKSVIPPYSEELVTMVESPPKKVESTSALTTDSLIPSSLNAESSSEGKPSSQEVREKKIKPKLLLPEWVEPYRTDWRDFCNFRGAGFKRRGKELILADLDSLRKSGNDPGGVLQQSIKNGWKGVFAIKEKNNGTGHNNAKNYGNGGNSGGGGSFPRKPTDREKLESSIAEGTARIAAKYGLDLGGAGRKGVGDIQKPQESDSLGIAEIRG